jgi:hypothetical protein
MSETLACAYIAPPKRVAEIRKKRSSSEIRKNRSSSFFLTRKKRSSSEDWAQAEANCE